MYIKDPKRQNDYRGLIDYLCERMAPGDRLIAVASTEWMFVWYYWHEKQRKLPYPAEPVFDKGRYVIYCDGEWQVDYKTYDPILRSAANVWVIENGPAEYEYDEPYAHEVSPWLDKYTAVEKTFPGTLKLRLKRKISNRENNLR
jgi:hypothetical protein